MSASGSASDYGLYEGALGKCLLAALAQEEVERIVKERSIPAHTDRTLTRPADLLAEVEEVRRRGWASSEQELNENNAVAAGVLGRNGNPDLLLLALGFAEQFSGPGIKATGELLVDVAAAIRFAAGIDDGAGPEQARSNGVG